MSIYLSLRLELRGEVVGWQAGTEGETETSVSSQKGEQESLYSYNLTDTDLKSEAQRCALAGGDSITEHQGAVTARLK